MKTLLAFSLLFFYSLPVFALGETGHRITGAIADSYLSESTRHALDNIIGTDTLAEISNYADEMRSNPAHFWQKVASPYHYVTVPDGKTYKDVGAPKRGDALFALNKYIGVLKDKKSNKDEQSLAVKMIVHLIGDLHQPLHVGNGLDRGGNRFRVSFFGKSSNLHRVWDSGMINQSTLSYTEWTHFLSNKISDQQIKDWSNSDPLVWIRESKDIRASIYPDASDSENDKPSLSYDYIYTHMPTLKQRLQQAGVRIALVLNNLLDDKTSAIN